MKNMHILISSVLCSYSSIRILKEQTGVDIGGQTMQKFYRLIARGLNDYADITCLSAIPIARTRKLTIHVPHDNEEDLRFVYPLIIDIQVIRQFCIFMGALFYGLKWAIQTKGNDRFVFCDVLNLSLCAALLPLRLFGIHVMGIMTDMPGLMICRNSSFLHKFLNAVNMYLLKKFDSYVFLTESMNNSINKNRKPYLVMEGIADDQMKNITRHRNQYVKEILYAGGLYEQYGVLTLIEAFRDVKGNDLRLILYGTGPMVKDMELYKSIDSRLEYRGLKANSEIVEAELSATLLVNPRPTHEEFVKYSFPSKNMEYMASGTPLLTTNLPGMPKEYHPFVFLFSGENRSCMAKDLDLILNHISINELDKKGTYAKEFVMSQKNNKYQAQRIILLYKK